ncbi:SCO2524 family protein [Cryptosporangium minutisporangium]|uniref:SCO2524 family protein n=1 Tax=Cryptosporangium minutisporangium TaxID=113569 RepID=A0ABP6TAH7_9ACTN
MKAQPRQHLLDIWEATARVTVVDGTWQWGGRVGGNSVSDAEQLLCLMYPASEVKSLKLDQPDQTARESVQALALLGDNIEIPRRLVGVLTEYMTNYVDDNGAPIFSGDSYFGPHDNPELVSPEQRALPIVESFSVSLTLTLATLGFVRIFRSKVTRDDILKDIDALEHLASRRLTAAMVGLLRSFTVNVFRTTEEPGRILIRTANQRNQPDQVVIEDLQASLEEVRAGLRDLSIGSGQVESDLDNPNRLFECGWSWSVIKDAPKIETSEDIGPQFGGVAPDRPSLYFTVNALAGILDLTTERTRVLRLLNEEQQRLAAALQVRYDLVRRYWATLATFGTGRWPLEDMPWRTSDAEESDYFTLLMTSLVSEDLDRRRATDAELSKILQVLNELASRGRITRRAVANDPAVALHSPGLQLRLVGSELSGPQQLTWIVSDYAAMLLKRTVAVAALARSQELRRDLLDLAEEVWTYLLRRRLRKGPGKSLWDQPAEVFPLEESLPRHERPSWYFTERIVESLVALSKLFEGRPLSSDPLVEHAWAVLGEAEQLFDQEQERSSAQANTKIQATMHAMRENLRRARVLVSERPATAAVLANDVLRALNELEVARLDAGRI